MQAILPIVANAANATTPSPEIPDSITKALNGYCHSNPKTILSKEMKIPSQYELVKTNAIFRHGARTQYEERAAAFNMTESLSWDCELHDQYIQHWTPSKSGKQESIETPLIFDVDGSRNLTKGYCLLGQLLKRGYDQEKFNGKWIAQNYFTDALTTKDISVRTTDVQRTKASARGVLEGLAIENKMDCNSESCVIPFHTMDWSRETMVPQVGTHCSEQDIGHDKVIMSPEYSRIVDENASMYQDVQNYINGDVDKLGAMGVMDVIKAQYCEAKVNQLPEQFRTDHAEFIVGILQKTDKEVNAKYELDDASFSKLVTGRLATEFTAKSIHTFAAKYAATAREDVEFDQDKFATKFPELSAQYAKYNGIFETQAGTKISKDAKLQLYSAHDSTVAPLAHALGVSDSNFPRYAAMINVDFMTKTECNPGNNDACEAFFRVIYNQEDKTKQFNDKCEDGKPCPIAHYFEKMSSWAEHKVTENFCQGSLEVWESDSESDSATSAVALVSATLMAALLFL